MAGYGDFLFLLCIKRQGNMLGCQKHVQKLKQVLIISSGDRLHNKQIQINIFRLSNCELDGDF